MRVCIKLYKTVADNWEPWNLGTHGNQIAIPNISQGVMSHIITVSYVVARMVLSVSD